MAKELKGRGMISPSDLDLMTITDSPREAVSLVTRAFQKQYGSPANPGRNVRRKPHSKAVHRARSARR
jgi:hypothetical protein